MTTAAKTKNELLIDIVNLQKKLSTMEEEVALLTRQKDSPLQGKEIIFRSLFELSADAIIILENGVVADCNESFLAMFRCSKEEIKKYFPKKFWPEFQPDGSISVDKARQNLISAVKEISNGPFFWRYLRGDGTAFDSESYLKFINIGDKTYLQCIIHDITGRQRARDLSMKIADTSSAAVFIVQKGKLILANPNWAKYVGYNFQELSGMDSLIFVHPDDREDVKRNAISMLKGERKAPYEYRFLTKSGEVRHAIETATSITYDGQRATLGNSMDITELKETRLKLNELQLLESSILDTIPHAVFGFQERRIIFANPAAEKIFGWKVEELLGKDARILYRNKEEYDETGWLIYAMLERQGTCSLEVPVRHKDGRDFFCILNASAIEPNVYKGRVVAIYEDITDRKKAEEDKKKLEAQLVQSQKMEAIGTLAGGLAHDFNNLMMGIQGCTSILMMEFQNDPLHYERLKSIEHFIQSGTELTRQLLGFARGGKYELKTIDLNQLIEKTASLFARTKKEISIHYVFADDIALVNVDRGRMEQVLLNMLVNAWQAMPQGGDIYLKTENVVLDDDFVRSYSIEPGKYVKLSVEDTGIGMDKRIKDRIFEPFFTTKETGMGNGLGLAMVYGIVRDHNGIVTVASKLHEGTRFDIYLKASETELENETSERQEIIRGSETILFVDDEKSIIEVTKEILEILGYQVYVAASGHEAVNLYMEKKNEIDLVIQDMVMPGMNGLETFQALKIINPDIKAILSSGYVMNQQIEAVMEQGCRAFIQKPFRIEDLSVKIREVLDNP